MAHIPPYWFILPFAGILLAIALCPLFFHHFWEKNKNRALVTGLFSVPTLLYVFSQAQWLPLLESLHEYFSFICLVGSLYIISGGISLRGDLKLNPKTNTLILLIGSILASAIGTTGASMLLIRVFLKTNAGRKNAWHLPIFFIFSVSNFGGLLTPLGDPPLFLGFLNGVPFHWTFTLLPEWILSTAYLLIIFYIWDFVVLRKEGIRPSKKVGNIQESFKVEGTLNFLLLLGVMASIFLAAPYREIFMIALSLVSLLSTRKEIHSFNQFSYAPIIEVAILFAGIFITMVPVLEILHFKAPQMGLVHPAQYFWATGLLSSFLDNAPTYLTFFNIAKALGLQDANLIAGIPEHLLRAISLGAVWMGANTYIGNGPNFMVKAIAEQQGYKTLNFGSYFLIALFILGPLYLLTSILFL